MILTGQEILKQVKDSKIKIEPYNEDAITTNAYDVKITGNL